MLRAGHVEEMVFGHLSRPKATCLPLRRKQLSPAVSSEDRCRNSPVPGASPVLAGAAAPTGLSRVLGGGGGAGVAQ